jgi:hypothetical protein
MSNSITFRLGPLPVRIEGSHFITDWARATFAPLRIEETPKLTFRFIDGPVHTTHAGDIGDDKVHVGENSVSFRLKQFDVKLIREQGLLVLLRQRDRRPLWLRSLSDPERAYKKWISHGASLDIAWLKDFVYKISPFALQCALLQQESALIHASGIELDGDGLLLPAWGGVGKSTLASQAVLHGRARFISDDHTIIDQSGTMHLHLLPIHLYAYHARQDPVLRERMFSNGSTINRLQWQIGQLVCGSQAVRWMSPEDIFSREKLAPSARIRQVIVMFRGDEEKFIWEPVGAAEAARPAAGIIVRELYGTLDKLALADAGWNRSILPDPSQALDHVRKVYESAFAGASCAKLLIPRRASATELVEFVRRHSALLDASIGQPRTHRAPPTLRPVAAVCA